MHLVYIPKLTLYKLICESYSLINEKFVLDESFLNTDSFPHNEKEQHSFFLNTDKCASYLSNSSNKEKILFIETLDQLLTELGLHISCLTLFDLTDDIKFQELYDIIILRQSDSFPTNYTSRKSIRTDILKLYKKQSLNLL